MKIGTVQLSGRVTLAPMAGYGDVAFRRLCRDFGAALTTTEMVSAKGLLYDNANTKTLLRVAENERPSCVQLFGGDPDVLFRAASLPAVRAFDIVDINMGCPVHKIVRNGEGSALMRDPSRAAACVEALRSSGRPVTAKFRLGVEEGDCTAPTFAAALEKAGVSAVAVHGRYAAQMYRGAADWKNIAEVKRAVSVPVFGNGDITDADTAQKRLETVDGVMIGRGALGHPDLFAAIRGKERANPLDVVFRHIDYMLAYFSPDYTVKNMRKHLGYYLSGVRGARTLRGKLTAIDDIDTLKNELRQVLAEVKA